MKNNFECLNKTMMGTDIFVALNQAMTRQFAGTFTSSVENITAAVNDILASAFETALMQDICPDMDKLWILRECINSAVLNGCRVSVPV